VPGITVDELLTRHSARITDIYTAIIDRRRRLGPIYEDAVNVGVLLKSDRKIAEVRPRVRSVQLLLYLPERVDDPQVARVWRPARDRILHVVNLTSPEQVDDQLGQWLELSYDFDTDGVRLKSNHTACD
jgi:hypothetical protein